MKATGIVRRIDDLGRVVIPKEIRRTLRIREGSPLEIFTDNDGNVIFKKYSPIYEMSDNAMSVAEVLHKLTNETVVVFDRDHVIAVSGQGKKEYSGRRVSSSLEELYANNKSEYSSENNNEINPIEGINKKALTAATIISEGMATGAVVVLEGEELKSGNQNLLMLTKASAMFLSKQIEE